MKEKDNNQIKEKSLTGFSIRTINEILKTWEKIVSFTRLTVTGKFSVDLSGADEDHIRKKIHECIFAKGGEISSRSRSIELGEIYLYLSEKGRERFMKILSREFDVDENKINEIAEKLLDSKDEETRFKTEMAFSKALIPPRVRLLKQFNALPNGFKFLIDFRAELLKYSGDDPYLKKLDVDLKRLLSSWFDVGLLDLKEITWQSPASLLEKLIEYEAVHEIQSWADLKNRLDSDRYCFAFFHNKIPDEPLIFVEVALVNEISSNIQKLLDEEAKTIRPEETNTAVFYSISNTQNGLAGINLGNFLIKQVVKELTDQLPNLKHFVTLSPVPRFKRWLNSFLLEEDEAILISSEIDAIRQKTGNTNAAMALFELMEINWSEDPDMVTFLKPILMKLCAHYLVHIKRGEKAYDPVANFHLTNGARIERINWLGDSSEKGIKQSAGIMVNYYYKLSDIEKNHELYISQSQIDVSKDVRRWLKKP